MSRTERSVLLKNIFYKAKISKTELSGSSLKSKTLYEDFLDVFLQYHIYIKFINLYKYYSDSLEFSKNSHQTVPNIKLSNLEKN